MNHMIIYPMAYLIHLDGTEYKFFRQIRMTDWKKEK